MSEAIRMREAAFKAREALARTVFDTGNLGQQIKDRSAAGFTDWRIVQAEPVDLSMTRAALHATGWLQGHGFATAWKLVEREERQRGRRTDLKLIYCELMIDWSGKENIAGVLSGAHIDNALVKVLEKSQP